MRIAIMQPYFFPYIGYFQLIRDVDLFVVYDDVNFITRSWISRNRILLGGAPHLFTLQLEDASSSKKINEIQRGDNRKKLLKTVSQAYAKAPCFREAMPLIEEAMMNEERQLSLYLLHQLQSVARYLNLSTEFILSSEVPKENTLRGQDKILAICEALRADAYCNAIGGMELYSEKDFAARGIDLKFIRSDRIEYPQFGNDFVPWLSIIDVLMFNPPRSAMRFLDAYARVPAGAPAVGAESDGVLATL